MPNDIICQKLVLHLHYTLRYELPVVDFLKRGKYIMSMALVALTAFYDTCAKQSGHNCQLRNGFLEVHQWACSQKSSDVTSVDDVSGAIVM